MLLHVQKLPKQHTNTTRSHDMYLVNNVHEQFSRSLRVVRAIPDRPVSVGELGLSMQFLLDQSVLES